MEGAPPGCWIPLLHCAEEKKYQRTDQLWIASSSIEWEMEGMFCMRITDEKRHKEEIRHCRVLCGSVQLVALTSGVSEMDCRKL